MLSADSDLVDALLESARYDDLEDLTALSSSIPLDSKDSQGRTALHMAAANGHLQIVQFLVSHGANVNALNVENNTPLHWACLNSHIEVVKKLVLAGADVSALNVYDRTPMDEALKSGKLDIADVINMAVAERDLNGVTLS